MTPIVSPLSNNDSESLQADVMRFMAIIAFCLVAIMALVRNVEPGDVAAASTAVPVPAPVPVSAPVTPPPEAADRSREPLEKVKVEIAKPAPTPRPQLQISRPVRLVATPPAAPRSAPLAKGVATNSVTKEVPSAPAAQPPAEQGLSLRFASDGDFLRLIAKGDIRVFAFNAQQSLELDDSYQFHAARTPHEIHELLPQTIPRLIVQAFERSRSDSATFTWGIVLPGAIRSQLDKYLTSVESGQLVINRYGEVRHVASR